MQALTRISGVTLVIATLVCWSGVAVAQIPNTISYQGILANAEVPPAIVPDGNYNLAFNLYTVPAGGSALWTETHNNVPVAEGRFYVALGSVSPLTGVAFNTPYFLGITVNSGAELPRIPLTASAYSLNARRVVTLDGATGGAVTGSVAIGHGHTAAGTDYFVAGTANVLNGDQATIAGGLNDTASGALAFVGAGTGNAATAYASSIVGGTGNRIIGTGGFIGGGYQNRVTNNDAVVVGGALSIAGGYRSFIGGGDYDTTAGGWSTISGGSVNTATQDFSTVGGGKLNHATGVSSTIAGGYENDAVGTDAGVLGGYGNAASGYRSAVGGGGENSASNSYAVVCGGNSNSATGTASVVGGGQYNKGRGDYAVVGGGGGATQADSNTAGGENSTVGGGIRNRATGSNSTIAGGYNNIASGAYAAVAGGSSNAASGQNSFCAGGVLNRTSGSFSFAAGYRAKADHTGSFVWGDANLIDVNSTASNQFIVRASGGTKFYSNPGLTAGVSLAAGANAWAAVSDSTKKRNIRLVDGQEILGRVARLPISRWSYKSQDPSIEHVGPMAQDFHALFGLGEDDKTISTLDPDGVALAAIQGLHQMVKERDAQIAALTERLEKLERRMEGMKR